MAENVQQSVEIPVGLSLFGSLDTELSPTDIPEGVSPDNQDVVYLPGSVASRPCLNKIYPSLGTVTIQYFKSYTRNDGTIYNLILDSTGKLWVENVTTNPGVLALLDRVAPGSFADSIKAFNREWIVFHNGINGTDNPRQFDGTFLDPVSQDGPGAGCLAADHQDPSDISSLAPILVSAISGISQKGNVVTVDTFSEHGLVAGESVIIAGTSATVECQQVLANTTSGSPVLIVNSVTDLTGFGWFPGMVLSGVGIPVGTTILGIASNPSGATTSSIVTMSQNATATASNITVGVLATYNGPTEVQTIPTTTRFTFLIGYIGLPAGDASGNVFLQKAICVTDTPHKGIVGDAVVIQNASVLNSVSTVGPMTAYIWCSTGPSDPDTNHPPHSGPVSEYLWKNAADVASTGPVLGGTGTATSSNSDGNSLIFDSPTTGSGSTSMKWSIFSAITAGLITGTVPLFTPAQEPEGYEDFQFVLVGTFFVPAAGNYRFTGHTKHDMLFGIQGATLVSNNNGGATTGYTGQTMTPLNGYDLLPRKTTNSGSGYVSDLDVTVSFPAPGNYNFEMAYVYWYHSGRTIQITCNGNQIAPLVVSMTTDNPYDTSVNGNPEFWPISSITGPNTMTLDLTGITTSAVNLASFGNASTLGTAIVGGMLSPGLHGIVVMFLTRQGFLTAPSTPIFWRSSGNCKVSVSQLPIGPENVIARVLGFTGSRGSSFFALPSGIMMPAIDGSPIVIPALTVNDNTSTEAVLDFSDTALFQGLAIDITGNNLFSQTVLGPVTGVSFYGSRLGWRGHRTRVPNMLNLGFEGGYRDGAPNTPLGWTVASSGGELVTRATGFAWKITGNGATECGKLRQACYQDYYGVSILRGGVGYSLSLLGQAEAGTSGNVVARVTDGTTVFSSHSISISEFSDVGNFVLIPLTPDLPDTLPPDSYFEICADSDLGAGEWVTIDSMQIVPTRNLINNQILWSYVNNPEALDYNTGVQASTDDPTPVQDCFEYHDSLHVLTSRGLHETSSVSNLEPSKWGMREISSRCGGVSPRCSDSGENFAIWVSNPSVDPPTGRGAYVFTGGQVYKISQEVQSYFDRINREASHTVWVKNDPVIRRAYLGLPLDDHDSPNIILTLDYRELDTASDLANRPPVNISFTGKMVCSDLSRKWSRWNIKANSAGTMVTASRGIQFCFGSGNGGAGSSYGNIYWLDPSKYTDDDYGMVFPYYTTYFFVNHEMEQSLGVGLHRKLFKRYAAFVTGVGQFQITPFANNLTNQYPPPPMWPLSLSSTKDIGDGLNVPTERCAFKIASVPLPGQTDNAFNLQKLIITLMQEPVAPLRYGGV
jgi:hypothetical protein